MGFKSIDSEEKIGDVKMAQGEAPRHVPEGHEKCAWYPVDAPGVTGGIVMRDQTHSAIVPGHVGDSPGAWYSEDYVRELRVAAQQVIRFYGMVGKEGSIGHRALLKLEELASDGS